MVGQYMNTSANPETTPISAYLSEDQGGSSFGRMLNNALIITRREVRDSLRDWRIMGPIVILTLLFPLLAQFVAGQFSNFLQGFGAEIIGGRTIPFLLMIVGFFPISISLVIALETFVGEKERRSLEPLLSTPLSNTELYIGKTLAAILPPLAASFVGMSIYLFGLFNSPETAWRPPAALVIQIFLLTTVQGLVMITGAVVVSSQTTSTRAANLLASFIIIPVTMLIWVESAIMFLAPDAESPNGISSLWAIIIGMCVVVALLLRVGNSIFNREELLGRTLDKIDIKGFFRGVWRGVRAIDDQGTKAANLFAWYRRGIPLSLRHLGAAIPLTIVFFVLALVGGYIFGITGSYQLRLPEGLSLQDAAHYVDPGLLFRGSAVVEVFMQNWRILALATALGIFTFGSMAFVLTPAVYFIIGYLASQLFLSGYDPSFLIPALLTHGIVEIPVIVIATAAALKLGAVVTRPPRGKTVGQAWTAAFADTVKLWLGVLLPGLLLAAIIEVYITPAVVAAFLRGS